MGCYRTVKNGIYVVSKEQQTSNQNNTNGKKQKAYRRKLNSCNGSWGVFPGIWSNSGNKILSKQTPKIRKQAKWINCQCKFSTSQTYSLLFAPSQWWKSHWKYWSMIWNRYAGKLNLFKHFTAKHTATLPPKTCHNSNTKLNTHSQTKECDFDLQDKK